METSVLFDVSSAASAAQSALIFCTIFLSLTLAAKNAWTAATLRLPPGPWGVPFLGVLPFLGKKRHITIQKWWEKYGNVYSMYMGSRLVIVINGLEAMKECFVKQADVFSARPDNYFKRLTQNTGQLRMRHFTRSFSVFSKPQCQENYESFVSWKGREQGRRVYSEMGVLGCSTWLRVSNKFRVLVLATSCRLCSPLHVPPCKLRRCILMQSKRKPSLLCQKTLRLQPWLHTDSCSSCRSGTARVTSAYVIVLTRSVECDFEFAP